MAGYICALAISLFAVITGIIFMIYPLYHKTCLQRTGNGKRN